MKLTLYKFSFFAFVLLLLTCSNLKAQTADPATFSVYPTSGVITVDGVLNEADWSKPYPYLLFGKNAVNYDGIGRTPTGDAVVKAPYTDSSITKVRFLQNGLDLYISLQSDDKQVCKFDWEGDGMFMKIKDAAGADQEFKFYVRKNVLGDWELGNDGAPAGSFEGIGIVKGTIYDSASVDTGYTAEMVVHLDKIGFVTAPSFLNININIFDPDNFSVSGDPWGASGSYFKQWWGSEWGNDRQITLNNSVANVDPASINVFPTTGVITIDGVLNEADWSKSYPYLMFKYGGVATGDANSPTFGWVVKGNYTDQSTTNVRFLQNGLDLYVSLQSDDKQVCKFDWEGDGVFMKIKDAAGTDQEFKFYVRKNVLGDWELGNDGAPALSFEGKGVVNGTIYDSASVDNGYIAEMVIHLDKLGFSTAPAALDLMVVIFDPDNYSVSGDPWGASGVYFKQWWGSEWGPTNRQIKLNNVVPVELTSFSANATQSGVELKWSTATETNNKGFEVQKSSDNKTFSTLGFVDGKGTSTSIQQYRFVDASTTSGKYYYRLCQIDFGGSYKYSDIVEVQGTTPSTFALSQNYPNPFNPTTTMQFSLASDAKVAIKVFDMLGREVANIVEGSYAAGVHKVEFNASKLASGLYVYQINAIPAQGAAFTANKIMTLLK
ncbi:MAG: T9SS type A sorting domain-containing protein [Ignavibacteriaceae bacterium]|jgi:hypothetical protein